MLTACSPWSEGSGLKQTPAGMQLRTTFGNQEMQPPPPAQGKASSGSPSELEADMDEHFCVHVCRGRTGNLYLDTFKVVACGRRLGLSTPTPCDACANQETSLANILHCHYSGQLVYFRIELVEVDWI